MARDESLAHAADARRAAADALDRPVEAVDRIERGVNALYRIEYTDGEQLVLKAPRYASDAAFLVEPALLDRIGRETTVPVPDIRATVLATDGPLETAYYLLEHLDGRDIHEMNSLTPETQRRFIRTAARHLAEIHDLDAPDRYGHLQYVDGAPRPRPVHETWPSLLAERVDTVTAELEGEGELSDDDPRFADLATPIRDAIAPESQSAIPATPSPAIVIRDYRPSNVVLEPSTANDDLVAGIFDVGGMVGDALFDVAKTEMALVDVPLGGTSTAQARREEFRRTYASHRDRDPGTLFDERYPYYRLYAMTFRLKAFEYSRQFARETDADALAHRWRSFIDARLAEIQ